MVMLAERINHPISTAELERRCAAVRKAMEERNIDVLLMQSNNDFMGGYVKWFTDVAAMNGYPVTVVFPRDDRATVIIPTKFGEEQHLPPEGDGLRRGVRRVLGDPFFSSAYYTLPYDAALAEKALEPYARGTIGLVGRGTLPVSMMDHLRGGKTAGAKFVDASDMVDQIKVIKSEEEWTFIRNTAAVQDGAIDAAMKAAAPGMRDIEIASVAEKYVLDHGGEQGLFLTCSHPPEGPAYYWGGRHLQNRSLRKGDMFTLLVESNGPGAFYTEISRSCVLGKANQEMKDEFAVLIEARNLTLSLLIPGASCADIWNAYNAFLKKRAKPLEERLYCHGQGYDLVERPLVRRDEPMLIRKDMNITCHPTWISDHLFNTICDNYRIGDSGVVEHLHKYPEKLVELG